MIVKTYTRDIATMPPDPRNEVFARYRCHCGAEIVETFSMPTRVVTVYHGGGEAARAFDLDALVGNYVEDRDGPIHPLIAAWAEEIHRYERAHEAGAAR